jgi:23S rRNA (pseudouridine1915-N3)-methyltransferase
MRIVVVQQGRIQDAHVRALRDAYVTRFRRYGALQIVEREAKPGQPLWPASSRYRVLCDDRGQECTSPGLAQLLADWTMRHGEVAFAIGGAHGHDAATVGSAQARLALGRLTLPHQLAHLILVEQIYRAASILAGSPYHHA